MCRRFAQLTCCWSFRTDFLGERQFVSHYTLPSVIVDRFYQTVTTFSFAIPPFHLNFLYNISILFWCGPWATRKLLWKIFLVAVILWSNRWNSNTRKTVFSNETPFSTLCCRFCCTALVYSQITIISVKSSTPTAAAYFHNLHKW